MEIPVCDLNNLLAGKLEMETFVTHALNKLKAKHKAKKSEKREHMREHKREQKQTEEAKPRASAEYSRYDQEIYDEMEDSEFSIDQSLTFDGSFSLSTTSVSVSSETELQPVATPRPVIETPVVEKKRKSRTPIIIVPPFSNSAVLTVHNVRSLLEDLHFVSSDHCRVTTPNRSRGDVLIKRKNKSGRLVPYRVTENPQKLSADDWDRVVACFGPTWQFKGWNWGGDPTQIFSHVAAFHVKFDDKPLDANVAKWNVTVLSFPKTKRHMDKTTLTKFWQILDKHVMKHKPKLLY